MSTGALSALSMVELSTRQSKELQMLNTDTQEGSLQRWELNAALLAHAVGQRDQTPTDVQLRAN